MREGTTETCDNPSNRLVGWVHRSFVRLCDGLQRSMQGSIKVSVDVEQSIGLLCFYMAVGAGIGLWWY